MVGNRNHEKVQVFIPDSVHAATCEQDKHSQNVLQENVKNNDLWSIDSPIITFIYFFIVLQYHTQTM